MRTMGLARLTKHHGLGNDFLIALVDAIPPGAAELAQRLCHRRTGLGADGLVLGVGAATDGTAAQFVLFNADGSRAEVSGNGLRCLGQALAMRAGVSELETKIDTDAGPRLLTVWPTDDPNSSLARVDMGPPARGPQVEGVPIADTLAYTRVGSIDMGNPHIVIEVPDPRSHDMASVGPAIEAHFMPTGTNVHLIGAGSTPDTIIMNIWERGAGVTEACGSGACAAASVANDWGLCDQTVKVDMPGGVATVEVTSTIHLIGPATYVAEIEVPLG